MNKLPPTPPKPPQWACSTSAEAKAMTDWVNAELDRHLVYLDVLNQMVTRSFEARTDAEYLRARVERTMRGADYTGNTEPLRETLRRLTRQDLGRFLKRPKLKTGEKFSKRNSSDHAKKAAADVLLIKALWSREFPGQQRRPKGDLVSAEKIAADRRKVSVEAVKSKRKNPRRK
jgi:hypothetical protein